MKRREREQENREKLKYKIKQVLYLCRCTNQYEKKMYSFWEIGGDAKILESLQMQNRKIKPKQMTQSNMKNTTQKIQ